MIQLATGCEHPRAGPARLSTPRSALKNHDPKATLRKPQRSRSANDAPASDYYSLVLILTLPRTTHVYDSDAAGPEEPFPAWASCEFLASPAAPYAPDVLRTTSRKAFAAWLNALRLG